jgi:hypothetical protein
MEEHPLTEFIVRILFTGMMVFIPSEDGSQLDIVLLNVGHSHQMSDGTAFQDHIPVILTRAGSCTGDCPRRVAAIASAIFGDLATNAALDALEAALSGGGGWVLTGSDLTLRKASGAPDLPPLAFKTGLRTTVIPTTSAEREDYSWLARLSQICPTCGFDSDVTGPNPPAGLIAARFRLTSGNAFTYSVARIGSDVTPVHFRRLDGTGDAASYTQAIATFMGADINVSGSSIDIVETKWDGSAGRTMTLSPNASGKVEIAVLNLPPLVPAQPTGTPGIGKHFERYYEVTANPPADAARFVPYAGVAPGGPSYPQVSWTSVHPQAALWSDLLNAIRLNPSRSAYDILLCPPASPRP